MEKGRQNVWKMRSVEEVGKPLPRSKKEDDKRHSCEAQQREEKKGLLTDNCQNTMSVGVWEGLKTKASNAAFTIYPLLARDRTTIIGPKRHHLNTIWLSQRQIGIETKR